MPRHSKVQLEVLRLYKHCLRAAEKKPGFSDNVKYEFRKNAAIPKTDMLRIEHMLRQGWRKLKMMQDPYISERKMANKIVYVQKLGRVPYKMAWDYQKVVAEKVRQNVKSKKEPGHTMLLLEHDPGIRSHEYSAEEETKLKALGADFHRTNRGGLITFHGPGQLTAYPILHLSSFNPGIKWYVCALERAVIRTCRSFGIVAETSPHTGVWVKDNKICALGIQGRHVTTHGIALNCNIDLSWYGNIIPCGIPDKGVTSMSKELDRDVTIDEVVPHFLKSFSEVFKCDIIINE